MNNQPKVVLLVGGVGGAKLAYGLYHVLPPENLTVIVNTGDDFWHYGLRISPDLDTITYTLSGLVNRRNGWGVADDSFVTFETLKRYDQQPWFQLGDKDLALHMVRTDMWHVGHPLTEITQHITASLGIKAHVLPMSDQPIATMIDTIEHGELPFQEYFVKHRWQPTLRSIKFDGVDDAGVTQTIRDAVRDADMIVVGPSNPWLSINPVLSVPGMRELLTTQDVPRIAVTPLIGGDAVKGPTAKIMRELGLEVSTTTVVEYYAGLLNGFIYDQRDNPPIIRDNIRLAAFDTLMDESQGRITLAKNLLNWAKDWTTL